jgi:hypothetical protein
MSVGVNKWEDYNFNIRVFPSKKDMIDAANIALDYNQKNIKLDKGFTYEDRVEKDYLDRMLDEKIYEDVPELEKGLEFFDKLLVETDMGGAFKKSRLKITDDNRGIFDFGLASQGLFRAIEYYSKELETESPDEFEQTVAGIVPDKFVITKKIFNTTSFYYKSKSGKEYELTQQQEGTKEMLELNPNALLKKTKTGLLYTEPTTFLDPLTKKKFSLKFKTKNKKSYLMFEKKGGKAKMVEIYFPIHGSIYLKHILPLLLVAKYLKQAGVMTRINILRMYHEQSDLFVMYGYPIKDYGDEIDFNEIALNGVDGRWWSSVQVMVRSLNDMEEAKKIKSFGNKPNSKNMRFYRGAGSQAGNHSDYVEVFSRYRNWYMDQIKQGLMPPLRVDKKLILFGGVFGAYGSFEDIKDDIIAEFFRVLDTVDFQFNKAEDTCKRIYKRIVTDKLAEFYRNTKEPNAVNPITQKPWTAQEIVIAMEVEKGNLIYDFKTYVRNLLTSTYSYPVGGFYEEPAESAKQLDEEFDEKIQDLNKFLKTV